MSEHLPECAPRISNWGEECICKYLRACEQRVLDDDVLAAAHHGQKGYEVGFRKGLDAAREAVAAQLGWEDADPSDEYKPQTAIWKFRALAAIDALRGDL